MLVAAMFTIVTLSMRSSHDPVVTKRTTSGATTSGVTPFARTTTMNESTQGVSYQNHNVSCCGPRRCIFHEISKVCDPPTGMMPCSGVTVMTVSEARMELTATGRAVLLPYGTWTVDV